MTTLPTVAELNNLSASQVSLLLLRCLGTSDLSWMSSLFQPATMADVAEVTESLRVIDEDDRHLTPEEEAEFQQLRAHIVE